MEKNDFLCKLTFFVTRTQYSKFSTIFLESWPLAVAAGNLRHACTRTAVDLHPRTGTCAAGAAAD